MIIIVFGLPGSGKSYFASRLAERISAEYVNSDRLRNKMISQKTYTEAEKLSVYDEMIKIMNRTLEQNKSIVLDATFYKQYIRKMFEQAADKHREKIIFIEVWATDDTIKERLNRPREHSDADYTIHQKIKKAFEPMESKYLCIQSGNDNIENMLQSALNHIKSINE